jgi:hypothetical protein
MHTSRRIVTVSPDPVPRWVRLYGQLFGAWRAAMILDDTGPPPGPDEVRGQGFFGDTAEEAEQLAKAFLGLSEPVN